MTRDKLSDLFNVVVTDDLPEDTAMLISPSQDRTFRDMDELAEWLVENNRVVVMDMKAPVQDD